MARGLKFQIKKEEGLYYLCIKKKGADQLPCYRAANLHLCFRIYKQKAGFLPTWLKCFTCVTGKVAGVDDAAILANCGPGTVAVATDTDPAGIPGATPCAVICGPPCNGTGIP